MHGRPLIYKITDNIISNATGSRRFWLADGRRRLEIVKHDTVCIRWRTLASFIKPALRAALAAVLMAANVEIVSAAFDAHPVSAQASAMGGSSLAGQGDPASMFLNAAGVAGLKSPETYLMYNKPYAGLSGVGGIGQGFVALGLPTKIGVLGLGLSDYLVSDLLGERVIGVTLARRWYDTVQTGLTLKYLHHRYMTGSDPLAANDPVFRNGKSRGAPAFDIGVSAFVTKALSAGLSVRNINQPNLGLSTEDRVPREIQTGLAYSVVPWALRATADYTYRAIESGTLHQRSQFGVGIEKSLQEGRVLFRVGATLDRFSGGMGVHVGKLGLDYSFALSRNLISNNAGTHQVGIRYRFGGTKQ